MLDVIITCHNYAQYLEECVDSIIFQLDVADTLTVVTDSCTDGSQVLIDKLNIKYERLKTKVRITSVNVNYLSPNKCRKHVFYETNNPYVMFLDADDKVREDYLLKVRAAIYQYAPDIIKTKMQEFGDSNRTWVPIISDINKTNFLHIGTPVKRNTINKSRAFDTENEFAAEDWEMWKRIFTQNISIIEIDTFYYYRKHGKSRMSDGPKSIEVSRDCITYYDGKEPYSLQRWLDSAVKLHLRPFVITLNKVDHPNAIVYSSPYRGLKAIQYYLKTNHHETMIACNYKRTYFNKDPYLMFKRSVKLYGHPENLFIAGWHDAVYSAITNIVNGLPGHYEDIKEPMYSDNQNPYCCVWVL